MVTYQYQGMSYVGNLTTYILYGAGFALNSLGPCADCSRINPGGPHRTLTLHIRSPPPLCVDPEPLDAIKRDDNWVRCTLALRLSREFQSSPAPWRRQDLPRGRRRGRRAACLPRAAHDRAPLRPLRSRLRPLARRVMAGHHVGPHQPERKARVGQPKATRLTQCAARLAGARARALPFCPLAAHLAHA